MIATVDDVLEGFRTVWAAAGLPRLVTGGLHLRFVGAAPTPPYGWVMAAPAGRIYAGSRVYIETFVTTVRIYTIDGTTDRRAIAAALGSLDRYREAWPPTKGHASMMRPRSEIPAPPPGSDVPTQARDVVEVAAAWDVLMQQVAER